MNSFALFRYPYEQQCTLVEQTDGAPLVEPSLAALSGHEGFVVAPFEVADQQPIVLIRPDRISVLGQNELRFVAKRLPFCAKSPSVLGQNRNRFVAKRSDYAIDFANFHAQLKAGAFSKIVLARCADEVCDADITPVDMFEVPGWRRSPPGVRWRRPSSGPPPEWRRFPGSGPRCSPPCSCTARRYAF